MSSIVDIATRIALNAGVIDKHLKSNGFKPLSFDVDADPEFPNPENDPIVEAARAALFEDTKTVRNLVLGPSEVLREVSWQILDAAVLRVIIQFKMPEVVPLSGSISYAGVAENIGLSERQVKLILRQSALNGFFKETDADHVAHTASSAILASGKPISDWFKLSLNEMFEASPKLADALEKYSQSDKPEDSAFCLAFNTKDPVFTYAQKHPELQQRFFRAMESVHTNAGYSLTHILDGYDWARLGKATVVDIGGSTGFVSVALAERYPALSFEVQDYSHVVEQGQARVPPSLSDRFTFRGHDMFTPQPTTADVYFLRHIFHNWSDANVTRLLRQIIPAMKPTSRIVVLDAVLPNAGEVDALQERFVRNLDVIMLQMLNTQERNVDAWKEVVTADPGLKILSIKKPAQSWDSIIEIGFEN